MILILSDGRSPPIQLEVKYLAVYDRQGITIMAADQVSEQHVQVGTIGDPDLPDIVKRHGLPYRTVQEVSGDFPNIDKGKVFKIR